MLKKIIICEVLFMGFLSTLATIFGIGSQAASAGTSVANTVNGIQMDKAALAEQSRMNDFNIQQAQLNNAFQEKIFNAQQDLNAQQQTNWQNQFDYQKYLNENQTQISARDAEAAGLNRLAMSGNSVSAGNSSSPGSISGGSITGASGSSQSYGQGISAMAQLSSNLNSIGSGIASRSTQKSIAAAGNKNAYDIAKLTDEAKKAQLGFDKEKWNLEKNKMAEETRNIHFLNEYEAAHGTPYQHRNQLADGIVAIAGLINKTIEGKGEVADLGKTIVDALKGEEHAPTSLPTIANKNGFDVEKVAEAIAESVNKKTSSTGFKYRYSRAPSNRNRAFDANDNRYSGR